MTLVPIKEQKELLLEDLDISSSELSISVIIANTEDILQHLRSIRKYRGFRIREVEELTGISNSYLSQLENGKVTNPSFSMVIKLLKLYKVKLNIF